MRASRAPLRLSSPQAGPVYAGMARLSMTRQDQTAPAGRIRTIGSDKGRFLQVEMFTQPADDGRSSAA